jgi:hypothetical protein
MGFKFLVFFDFDPEDWDKVLEQWKEMEEVVEGRRTLFQGHMLMGDLPTLTKKLKTFTIVEYDDPDILVKSRASIMPDKPAFIGRFVRIDDFSDIVKEYEKRKK